MRISEVGKGGVVAGLAATLFAGVVASAAWLPSGAFNYHVESDQLAELQVSNVVVSQKLLPVSRLT